ncbi:MAG: endopeptidase La, partial [Clostridia bacterium]|nr:endopeptidase La [Clostridia bacterium]
MQIIELNGYTMSEKKEIAKRYLCTKKTKENGLTEAQIAFTDEALSQIIDNYTLEAGVRSLERHIGTVCRKVAFAYADCPNLEKITVDGAAV